jgi:hypothetical protein
MVEGMNIPAVLDPFLAWIKRRPSCLPPARVSPPHGTRRPSVLPPRRVPAVAICPVAALRLGDALAIERGARS